MNEKVKKSKTITILGYVIKINKAWYITLCLGVVVNLYLNHSNYLDNKTLESKVASLVAENKDLKQAYNALLDNMVAYNRTFDDFDLEVWNKVKKKDSFYSNYYNLAYESKHFKPKGENRHQNMGRTDFQNGYGWIADFWYKNDLEVAITGVSKIYDEPAIDSLGKVYWIKDWKWRRIKFLDTLVYGMKLPEY
ncbi:hypothetical protein [Algibacter sp. PT7-4]|uniref:hypothetical protein n=1 Tax=Algibacter ulvanivorans TaxID=3400999 RepID=UPI003AAF1016